MAQMEPSIPIDPSKIPEGMDQDYVIHEVPDGEAVMAVDPVTDHPEVSILTVRDPMAPPGFRVASIALDQEGLAQLHRRVGNLMTGRTDPKDSV